MICRWAFYGDDWHAQHLRGEHPDQVENAYLTPVSAYKPTKIADKIVKARAFIEDRERRKAEVKRQTTVTTGEPETFRASPPPPPGEISARIRSARTTHATPIS